MQESEVETLTGLLLDRRPVRTGSAITMLSAGLDGVNARADRRITRVVNQKGAFRGHIMDAENIGKTSGVKEQMAKVNVNPENNITICLAETKDWQTIRDIMLKMLADAPHAFGETLAKAKARDVNEWKQMTEQLTHTLNSCAYIAQDRQGVCGFVLADTGFPQLPSGAVLAARLWVSPRRRGMGLGRKLMDVVSCWAREQGMDQIYVAIMDTNLDVVKFYEHLGYYDTGRREQLPDDAQRQVIVMARKLEQ